MLVLVTVLQWGTDWYDVVGLKLGRVRVWVRVLGLPVVAARGIAMLRLRQVVDVGGMGSIPGVSFGTCYHV